MYPDKEHTIKTVISSLSRNLQNIIQWLTDVLITLWLYQSSQS